VTALWVARAARAALHAWSQPSSALDTPEPPFWTLVVILLGL